MGLIFFTTPTQRSRAGLNNFALRAVSWLAHAIRQRSRSLTHCLGKLGVVVMDGDRFYAVCSMGWSFGSAISNGSGSDPSRKISAQDFGRRLPLSPLRSRLLS